MQEKEAGRNGPYLACSSGSFLCLCMWNMRSPPFTYSITKKSLYIEEKYEILSTMALKMN